MPSNDVVTVRNVGKRLALVGMSYLYPQETRQCTRAEYDAARRAGNELVLVLDETSASAETEANELPPMPPAETEQEKPKAPRPRRSR